MESSLLACSSLDPSGTKKVSRSKENPQGPEKPKTLKLSFTMPMLPMAILSAAEIWPWRTIRLCPETSLLVDTVPAIGAGLPGFV